MIAMVSWAEYSRGATCRDANVTSEYRIYRHKLPAMSSVSGSSRSMIVSRSGSSARSRVDRSPSARSTTSTRDRVWLNW